MSDYLARPLNETTNYNDDSVAAGESIIKQEVMIESSQSSTTEPKNRKESVAD